MGKFICALLTIPYMMISKYIVNQKDEKFVRISLKDIVFEELFLLLTDKNFIVFFIVFYDDQCYVRYKIPKVNNKKDFNDLILNSFLEKQVDGLNSDNFFILEALFIDCYKYPNKL